MVYPMCWIYGAVEPALVREERNVQRYVVGFTNEDQGIYRSVQGVFVDPVSYVLESASSFPEQPLIDHAPIYFNDTSEETALGCRSSL
jgi:hypothetical protein